jgi:tetratricopeptide (TPR) repeat protein
MARTVRRFFAVFLLAAASASCDTYHFVSGTLKEDARRPAQAIKHYEKFLASKPKDPRSCEVRLRAAEIYRRVFSRCEEARAHYEAAARDFPKQQACVSRAKASLMLCPDFFPTDDGRTWVYVDSASKGRAARFEWEARSSTATAGSITSSLFAGDKRIQQKIDRYEKADWAVWRVESGNREAILRYPYVEAQGWSAQRGKTKIEYLVASASEAVKVAAGSFTGCLKIRERDLAFKSSWKYDYYCPGVGRVKTTVGGPGYENPNMELSRFGKID